MQRDDWAMEFSQIVKLEYNELYYIRIKQIVLKIT